MDAWAHPGLPHIRLNLTVVDAEAVHYSSAMRRAQDTAPAAAQAEKTKENKYGKAKGGVGVTGIAMQRFGPGLRAITKAAGRDSAKLHELEFVHSIPVETILHMFCLDVLSLFSVCRLRKPRVKGVVIQWTPSDATKPVALGQVVSRSGPRPSSE